MSKISIDHPKTGRILVLHSVIALFIVCSPYFFYLYKWLPEGKIWETVFFTFTVKAYNHVETYGWLVISKIVPLMLLTLWFFTCRHWWYLALLVPMTMYLFQIISVVNGELRYIDEVEIYWMIPVMAVVAPLVYWIRIRLFEKYVYGIDVEAIDEELKEYELKEKLEKKEKWY